MARNVKGAIRWSHHMSPCEQVAADLHNNTDQRVHVTNFERLVALLGNG
jgi:hypothetical protein